MLPVELHQEVAVEIEDGLGVVPRLRRGRRASERKSPCRLAEAGTADARPGRRPCEGFPPTREPAVFGHFAAEEGPP